MKYERKFIRGDYVDMMFDLKEYSDWRLVGFTFDSNVGLYMAVLEREVK